MEQNEQSQEKKGLLELREEEPKKPLIPPKVAKEIREWVISLATAFILVVLIRSFLFTIIRVDGGSMLDTLKNNDRLFVTVLDVKLDGPERFDVVICRYPNRKDQYVKRVIGMPGDTIMVRRGVLYINDEPVEEPFLSDIRIQRFNRGSSNFGPVQVPEDCYFVMGDNRDDSNDSRAVGMITREMMIGKVRWIIWPPARMGTVAGSEVYAQ